MSLIQVCNDAAKCRIHHIDEERRYFVASAMVDAAHTNANTVYVCFPCSRILHETIQERHRHDAVKLTRLEKEMGYRIV